MLPFISKETLSKMIAFDLEGGVSMRKQCLKAKVLSIIFLSRFPDRMEHPAQAFTRLSLTLTWLPYKLTPLCYLSLQLIPSVNVWADAVHGEFYAHSVHQRKLRQTAAAAAGFYNMTFCTKSWPIERMWQDLIESSFEDYLLMEKITQIITIIMRRHRLKGQFLNGVIFQNYLSPK